jgi:hypothetical protein
MIKEVLLVVKVVVVVQAKTKKESSFHQFSNLLKLFNHHSSYRVKLAIYQK